MVSTYRLVLGNLLSFIGYMIDYIVGFKSNKKDTIIKFSMLASSCSIISNLFLAAYGGAVNSAVTVGRLGIIRLKDKKNERFRFVFIGLCLLYMTSLLDWRGYFSVLIFISQMLSFISKWFFENVQHIRVFRVMADILYLPYTWLTFNVVSLIMLSVDIIITVVSYIKWSQSASVATQIG